jgi:hypothetical protein
MGGSRVRRGLTACARGATNLAHTLVERQYPWPEGERGAKLWYVSAKEVWR